MIISRIGQNNRKREWETRVEASFIKRKIIRISSQTGKNDRDSIFPDSVQLLTFFRLSPLGAGEKRDRMFDFEFQTVLTNPRLQLNHAARISSRNGLRSGRNHMLHFPIEQLLSGLRLSDVVNSGTSTTPGRFSEFAKFESWDGFQQTARLLRNLLTMTEMTRFVIRHSFLLSSCLRRSYADFIKPFRDVANFPRPFSSFLRISRIFFQQAIVMLQMRTASGRIRDNRIERIEIKLIDISLRQLFCQLPFAVVTMKRTATRLQTRRHDFAIIRQKHICRIAIDVGKRQILNTAGQKPDPIFFPVRRLRFANDLLRKLRANRRRERFEFAKVFRKKFRKSKLSKTGLQSGCL